MESSPANLQIVVDPPLKIKNTSIRNRLTEDEIGYGFDVVLSFEDHVVTRFNAPIKEPTDAKD